MVLYRAQTAGSWVVSLFYPSIHPSYYNSCSELQKILPPCASHATSKGCVCTSVSGTEGHFLRVCIWRVGWDWVAFSDSLSWQHAYYCAHLYTLKVTDIIVWRIKLESLRKEFKHKTFFLFLIYTVCCRTILAPHLNCSINSPPQLRSNDFCTLVLTFCFLSMHIPLVMASGTN